MLGKKQSLYLISFISQQFKFNISRENSLQLRKKKHQQRRRQRGATKKNRSNALFLVLFSLFLLHHRLRMQF